MQKGQEAKKANTQQRETELKELNARIDILESKVRPPDPVEFQMSRFRKSA